MQKIILVLLVYFNFAKVNAQTDTTKSSFSFSGYLEAYYIYDFAKPANHERPAFFYSFNRHNEINLNLAFVKASYSTQNIRANLALMTGTYALYNLSAEHPVFQHLLEGNIGIKISETKNLWIDAGVFSSHIGFESAIGKDCWNLTRSILAENSPYYESGAKISFTSDNEKWFFSGLFLNGWQHIQRLPGNQTPSFGTQITFTPNPDITLNWSTFTGNEQPDSQMQWRYFNNFYGQFQLHKKFGIIAGFDIGAQQDAKGSNNYNLWYCPVVIARFSASDNFSIAARAEYYSDENEVIISTGTPNGFQTFGYSLNLDYKITKNVLCRIEGRSLNSKDQIFVKESNPTNINYFAGTSLSVSF